MFCKYCGKNVPDDTEVCEFCGGYVSGSEEQSLDEPQKIEYNTSYTEPSSPDGEQRSKLAAGLLGIFLGWLGIHNFYLGYNGKAIAQVVLTVLCCGWASGIWGLIEGILILVGNINTDAKGVPLKD